MCVLHIINEGRKVFGSGTNDMNEEEEDMPGWLKDAVFYEIYPQSFCDTNGDGIGDIEGIIEKLDYIKDLGCNALWINPCFDSPFKDAGYDVRDYKKIAPRYGTNDDAARLIRECHARGMHIFFDLVPGHTSEEHEWFRESSKAEKNEYSGRYIWTDMWLAGIPGHPYIGGEAERNGTYMLNFFKCQPALNYGFLHPTARWMDGIHSENALATRAALKDVMRFWLDMGLDGFRVDMANSLVKDDDEQKSGTQDVWRDVRKMLDEEYPDAAMVAEWGVPEEAIPGGFHMDFSLDWEGSGYKTLLRDYEKEDPDLSYFRKSAHDGAPGNRANIMRFLKGYMESLKAAKAAGGYISLITGNHDTPRIRRYMGEREVALAFAVIFTLPGVPFLYYGDEIGMKYAEGMATKEGGYTRTGTRTPMQWTSGKNFGFSTADAEKLYLPVGVGNDVSVEAEEGVEGSMLEITRSILSLRHSFEDLQADADLEIVYAEEEQSVFAYRRGNLLCAVNPSGTEQTVMTGTLSAAGGDPVFAIGSGSFKDSALTLAAQSFAVWKL